MKTNGLINNRLIGINMTSSTINLDLGGYNSSQLNNTGYTIQWIKLNSDGQSVQVSNISIGN